MINVVDRVPTYPNRIKVTKSDGTSEYVTWERADEPTVPGTPINKALFDSIVGDIGLNKTTTVYVSTAGSDTLGDGTAANPYATITKALNSLPKNLNGYDALINIAAGTYAEDVDIHRFSGGNIFLTGATDAAVSLRSLRASFGAMVRIEKIALSLTGSIYDYALGVTNASLAALSNIKIVGGAPNGVYLNTSALCYFSSLEISNTTVNAIHATHNSSVYVASISGANNTGIGIRSIGGAKVTYSVSTLTATTATSALTGGRIYGSAQIQIPNY
jgi:hypothetical protein